MSALDKLENYTRNTDISKETVQTTSIISYGDITFNTKTSGGYFLNKIHTMGFNIVDPIYDKEALTGEYKLTEDGERILLGYEYSELYKAITSEGTSLVASIAGSGKTTALTLKIQYDVATGRATHISHTPDLKPVRCVDKIWVCTFLSSGASELKERLVSMQRKMGYTPTAKDMAISTIHAEFRRLLNSIGEATPIPNDSFVYLNILNRCIDKLDILTIDREKLAKEDYSVLQGIVTFYRNRLDDSRYDAPSIKDYALTPYLLDKLVEMYAQDKKAEGVMDFEDLQDLLYKYLYTKPNPYLIELISNRYKYIYIDEFQDTSQIQYEILKIYFTGAKQVFVIGDDDQSVYSFRGADVTIICEKFIEDTSPNVLNLSVNYRCPSNILKAIAPSIEKNKVRLKKGLHSSAEGGEIKAIQFGSIFNMLNSLHSDLMEDKNLKYKSAIICRTNYDAVIPALLFEVLGDFNYSISSLQMTLNTPLAKKILGMSCFFTEKHTTNVKNALLSLCSRDEYWKVNDIMKTLKNDNIAIWGIPHEELVYSTPNLARNVLILRKMVFQNGKRVSGGDILALQWLYEYLAKNTYNGDSTYAKGGKALIDVISYALATTEYTSVYDFTQQMIEYQDNMKGRIKKKDVDVRVVTAHEFKGKECHSTYVWNDSVDVFPSYKCDITNELAVEEERRVHYIACTRAKCKHTIYTTNPGMFLMEMDLQIKPYQIPTINMGKPITGKQMTLDSMLEDLDMLPTEEN